MAQLDPKDPDETDAFFVDWSTRLTGGDTITASAWPEVDDGVTVVLDSFDADGAFTTAWVSGGQAGQTYSLTNRISTAQGRTLDRTIGIPVENL